MGLIRLLAAVAALGAVSLSLTSSRSGALADDVAAPAHGLALDTRVVDDFRGILSLRSDDGPLVFLGGLELKSADPAFGGLSGLRTVDHGRQILAINDEGAWVHLRLATDATGRPSAVAEAAIAPLLDEFGHPHRGKWRRDAESLTLGRGEHGWIARVGYERRHRIAVHEAPTLAGLLTSPGRRVAVPPDVSALPPNEGLEALADLPDGRLVAIAETAAPGTEANPGWILGAGETGRFRLATPDGFAVTDAAALPNGDLLVLERKFSVLGGIAARIVRVPAADLAAGRTIVPEILLGAASGDEIDNMEGLAVDTAPDGTTIVTLVSDDNFSWLQRTLLLRFRLRDGR